MTDLNITLSYDESPEMNANNFKPMEVSFLEAEKLLQAKGKWVLAQFKNNYRKSDNYIQNTINSIAIDIDDGFSIEQFKKTTQDLRYALGTTKSHQKPKNNVTCDRYRVIFPLQTYFNLSAYEYSLFMNEVNRYFNADLACKDVSRQFRGNPGAEFFIHNSGELLDWELYLEKAKKRMAIDSYCRKQEYRYNNFDINGDKDKFFRFAKRKFDKIYVTGNRNNSVADIVLWGKNKEIDYNLLCSTIRGWVMESGESLPERELQAIFRYHRR